MNDLTENCSCADDSPASVACDATHYDRDVHANDVIPKTDRKKRLEKCEVTIRSSERSAWAEAEALADIRSEELYKEAGYNDFPTYARERWNYKKSTSLQLVQYATYRRQMRMVLAKERNVPSSEIADSELPSNPRKFRALAKLKEPQKMLAVWQSVQKASHNHQPPQEEVEIEVRKLLDTNESTRPTETKLTKIVSRLSKRADTLVPDLTAVLEQIKGIPKFNLPPVTKVTLTHISEQLQASWKLIQPVLQKLADEAEHGNQSESLDDIKKQLLTEPLPECGLSDEENKSEEDDDQQQNLYEKTSVLRKQLPEHFVKKYEMEILA